MIKKKQPLANTGYEHLQGTPMVVQDHPTNNMPQAQPTIYNPFSDKLPGLNIGESDY
jgi:hypothetical protein